MICLSPEDAIKILEAHVCLTFETAAVNVPFAVFLSCYPASGNLNTT